MNRSTRSVLAALGLAAGLASLAVRATAGEGTPLEVALEHFQAGRFDEALDATEQVGKDDPLRPRAAYVAGEVSLARGDAPGAEAYLREAAEAKPVAPAYGALGRAYLAQGKAEEAAEAFEKATLLDPKTARYRAGLALAHLRAGRADVARKELAVAAKLAPDDGEVVKAVVEERLAAADADGASKAVAALGKTKKDPTLAAFLEGVVLDRQGKTDDAIAAYERALKADPGFLDAHKNLAILCVTQNPLYTVPKRTKLAMEHFAAYVERGGRDAEVLKTYDTLKSFFASQGGGK